IGDLTVPEAGCAVGGRVARFGRASRRMSLFRGRSSVMCRTFFRPHGDGAGAGDRHGRTCGRRGGLPGVRLRRLLAAAVAVPVLAVPAAACSGEGGGAAEGEQSGGEQAEGGKGPGSGGGSADGDDGGGAPLDEQELRKALLKSGDVKGYRAQRNKDEDA